MTIDMQAALKYIDEQLTEYLEGMPNDETSRRLRDTARAALAPRHDAQADERGAWRIGTPPVPEGKCREFILAVRRAQSNPPGKVFVFSANYANEFTDDGCLYERNGEEIFVANGWHLCALDASGEFNEVYEPIVLNEDDEIVGWQPLPKWQEARAAAPAPVSEPEQAFQARVKPWMLECFGSEIAADTVERNHRFFEEAAELVQACGMEASEAHQLVDYTWSRPVGERNQEAGGVMVTLAALCLAQGLDMHAAGETELARISAPETMAKIRAKQAAKPKHSPLPEARPDAPLADERGAFEAWAQGEFKLPDDGLERQGDDYRYSGICDAWAGWQARAAAPQAEAAQGVPAGWKPIETAPKDGTCIRLAWSPDDWTMGDGLWRGGKWVASAAFYSARLPHPHIEFREYCPEPTHWMPLPSAPSPDREQVGCLKAAETKLYADYARIGEAFMDMCNDLGCPNDTNMLDWARDRITCDTCHGTGRICIGNSGQESDGNAPEFERCPSCGYGDASPSRERVEPRPDCCDTPSYCSSVRRCTAKDAEPPPAENSSVRNKIAAALHYPDHWDTAAYPTLDDAAWEAIAAAKLTCSECAEQPSERGEQGEAKGVCKRCGGTGFVDDGEITGVGGMEFENGPVRRVKDCPDCDASAPTLSDESADDIAVDSFARAMKSKMAEARAKGRSGWEGMDPADLSHMLRQHVEKGDPRDVANFCMMLWHHSAPIAPAVAPLTDMLKRMLSEFGDHHYHGCPQDLNHPTGACKCFAGALCDEARALLAKGGE